MKYHPKFWNACPMQKHLACVTAKKRCLIWLLLFVVVIGGWVLNFWLTINGEATQNHGSEADYHDLPSNTVTSSGGNSQTYTTVTSQLSWHDNTTSSTNSKAVQNLNSVITSKAISSNIRSTPAATSANRPAFTMLEVHPKKRYKLFNVTDFTFLHNPATTCQAKPLIVIVHTAITNTKRREVIRNTWGKNKPVFFMLGHTALPVNNTVIDDESTRYNDIVQGSFIDTYRNLTYKHVMALQWVLEYCPDTNVIVKVDDDVHVHLELLQKYVENLELVNKTSAERNCSVSLMLCDLLINNPVLRKEGSKWKVTKEEYQPDTYPPYCFGWGIIYFREAASCLLKQISTVPFLWVDDAYVTGLLAEAAKMKPTQIERDKLGPGMRYFTEKLQFSRLEKFATNAIIGPNNLGVEEMDYLGRIVSMYKCMI